MGLEELGRPPEGTTELTRTLVRLVPGLRPLKELEIYLFLDLVLFLCVRRSIVETAQESGAAFGELRKGLFEIEALDEL
jgi:hypothetical protein